MWQSIKRWPLLVPVLIVAVALAILFLPSTQSLGRFLLHIFGMLSVGFIGILTAQWLSRVAFPRLKNQHKRKAIKNSAGMIGFIASYVLLILGLRENGKLRPVAEKYLPQEVLTNIADIEIFIPGIVVAFSVIVFELFFKKLK